MAYTIILHFDDGTYDGTAFCKKHGLIVERRELNTPYTFEAKVRHGKEVSN